MTGPTKLTDEVSEAICTHARAGMPLNRAAALSRINRITAWRWMNEGAAELGPKARFALNYGEARAAYLLELSDCVEARDRPEGRQHGEGDRRHVVEPIAR